MPGVNIVVKYTKAAKVVMALVTEESQWYTKLAKSQEREEHDQRLIIATRHSSYVIIVNDHCQVTLTVIYPEAFIHGGEEYHVDAGSPVALTCVIGQLDDEDDDDDDDEDDDDDDDNLDIFHDCDDDEADEEEEGRIPK